MARRKEAIGYCIYCGDRAGSLSDEHIVAFSLGGDVILPDASCDSCARITSQFELDIARRQLGDFRVGADLPTRRAKRRPAKLRLDLIDADGTERSVEVNPENHPTALLMPDLPEPLALVPAIQMARRPFRIFLGLPNEGRLHLAQRHGADAFRLGSFEIGSWYRLLAKVAHGGAFYHPGDWTELWEPVLPSIILGRDQSFENYVGGTAVREFEKDDGTAPIFYRTVAVGDEMLLVCYFRLFGQNDTPTYQVVVGKRRALESVPANVLRGIHPDGLAALAVDLDKTKRYLAMLDDMRKQQASEKDEK